MFTLTAIQQAEQKIQTGKDFPQFIQEIKQMGVVRNDVYVMDGMSIYFGEGNFTVEAPAVYEALLIEEQADAEAFKLALQIHQQGETDYQTFCRQAAAAGVEKWVIDLELMTVTYLSVKGEQLLTELIPS